METVKEKLAYLRGILDTVGDSLSNDQTKQIFHRIIEVLGDLADDVDDLFTGQDEVDEYVEAIDADLADLEDCVYEWDEEGEDHVHADGCSCEDVEMVEIECPNCHELVAFEEDFLYDDHVEITCPECGEVVYVSEEFTDQDEKESEVEE